MQDEQAWHLDRKVPIGIILALSAHAAMGFWWASKMEARLEGLISAEVSQNVRISATEATTQSLSVGAATVNAQMQSVRESLDELKQAQRETNDLLRQLTARTP